MKNHIEISQSALVHNFRSIQKLCQDSTLVPVLKSNAYGHGLLDCYKILKEEDLEWIAVNYIFEAESLRNAGFKKRIMIVGPTHPSQMSKASALKLDVLVSNFEQIDEASRHRDLNVHIKIDTGMSRQGFQLSDLDKLSTWIKDHNFTAKGIASHFSNVEDVLDNRFAIGQIKEFEVAISNIGTGTLIKHIASSASGLIMNTSRFDLVRAGISLYGYWPSKPTKLSFAQLGHKDIELKPVLSWKSEISLIKMIPSGRYVGYGCLYKTNRETKVAIIPVGYYEGFPRLAGSKQSYVLIAGQRCAILGRICMNMMIVDITHIENIELYEEVTLIGKSGDETITASDIAEWAETIHYEILACLNPAIDRKIVD